MASAAVVDHKPRPGLRPKRTQVIGLYTDPPDDATVVCADELGPVVPRTFPPAPGWSTDGHRIKAPLDYARGPEKTWVYGSLRPSDGQAVTMTAPSRNSVFYQQFLARVEAANPGQGPIYVITDNLSSHNSKATREWLEHHPRIAHVFIPVGACWLNLQEAWWRIFRRHAIAGQCFADPDEIDYATRLATGQLNAQAKPWIWGRPPPPARTLRRCYSYRL
jgi:transposase